MEVCWTLEPSLGKVKMLRSQEGVSVRTSRRAEDKTHRRLLPVIPMRPSGQRSAEKLQAWSSVSKMRGVNWRIFCCV